MSSQFPKWVGFIWPKYQQWKSWLFEQGFNNVVWCEMCKYLSYCHIIINLVYYQTKDSSFLWKQMTKVQERWPKCVKRHSSSRLFHIHLDRENYASNINNWWVSSKNSTLFIFFSFAAADNSKRRKKLKTRDRSQVILKVVGFSVQPNVCDNESIQELFQEAHLKIPDIHQG